MYGGADDDVDFFTPTPASAAHLASLFQGIAGGGEASQDLVYTAPKQPPKVEAAKPKPRTNNKVICAKTVQLFKLSDSNYAAQGRHGVAIIGDPESSSYDLIIYLSRQNILGTSKLSPAFTYTRNDPVIGQFVDDQRRTFRVHFDNFKEHDEFIDELRKTGAAVMNLGNVEPADDQLSDGSQARAHILERISKVGQSMLPTTGKNPDLSESEPDEVVKTKKTFVRKPKRHSTSEKETTDGYEPPQQQQQAPSHQYMLPVAASQPYTLSQYVPNQLVQCVPGQVMSLADPLAVHFAENRTHNSEVRMNLSQLSNKLDSVLSELTNLRSVPPSIPPQSDRSYLLNKIEELERKLGRETEMREQLEHGRNVNTNLKNDVDELRKRIEEREASISELERSKAEAEARIAEQQVRIAELENCNLKNEEVSGLRETTERQVEEISSLTRNNENLRITIKELEDKVENYRLKLEDFTKHQKSDQSPDKLERERIEEDLRRSAQKQAEENESLRLTVKDLEEKVANYQLIVDNFTEHHETPDRPDEVQKQENESLRSTIKELEDKVENYRLKLEDLTVYYNSNKLPDKLERERIKEEKVKAFSENVKTYMNVMYQNILDWTNVDGSFRKSLTQNMKSVTFHIIQVYRDSLNEAELIESTDVKDDTALPPAVPEFEVTV